MGFKGIGVGSSGRSSGSSEVSGNKLRSDEHILIPFLLHWQNTNWCRVQRAKPSEAQGLIHQFIVR